MQRIFENKSRGRSLKLISCYTSFYNIIFSSLTRLSFFHSSLWFNLIVLFFIHLFIYLAIHTHIHLVLSPIQNIIILFLIETLDYTVQEPRSFSILTHACYNVRLDLIQQSRAEPCHDATARSDRFDDSGSSRSKQLRGSVT